MSACSSISCINFSCLLESGGLGENAASRESANVSVFCLVPVMVPRSVFSGGIFSRSLVNLRALAVSQRVLSLMSRFSSLSSHLRL